MDEIFLEVLHYNPTIHAQTLNFMSIDISDIFYQIRMIYYLNI